MSNSRPRIKVPLQFIDLIIELSSIAIILLMWCYCIINYADLPDTIATHFNGLVEPDGFGNKLTIWIIPIIATVIYVGLFILNKYPYMHNYMVNITQDNALKNYRLNTRVLRVINFLCALLMTYLTYMIVESAFGKQFNLGTWFVPIVIGVSIILPIVLVFYMRKLNK